MNTQLQDYIVEQIDQRNKRHAKKIKNTVCKLDDEYKQRAEDFYKLYKNFAEKNGKSLDFGINSYLRVIDDMVYEHIRFVQSGEYSCKSFQDANERVYSNPEIMEYYMHGLMLTQFLWEHHYKILKHFTSVLEELSSTIKSYLEIGGGHGLYFNEAIKYIGTESCRFDLVDISKSSIEMATQFIKNDHVNFIHSDIFKYTDHKNYDFITMGEVLEHVENPTDLLCCVNRLLVSEGYLFLTVPINSPAIDHIYLFNNAKEIQDLVLKEGFKIIDEKIIPTEDISLEKAKQLKITIMYSALLKKI